MNTVCTFIVPDCLPAIIISSPKIVSASVNFGFQDCVCLSAKHGVISVTVTFNVSVCSVFYFKSVHFKVCGFMSWPGDFQVTFHLKISIKKSRNYILHKENWAYFMTNKEFLHCDNIFMKIKIIWPKILYSVQKKKQVIVQYWHVLENTISVFLLQNFTFNLVLFSVSS